MASFGREVVPAGDAPEFRHKPTADGTGDAGHRVDRTHFNTTGTGSVHLAEFWRECGLIPPGRRGEAHPVGAAHREEWPGPYCCDAS
jgi:hypothetical protein